MRVAAGPVGVAAALAFSLAGCATVAPQAGGGTGLSIRGETWLVNGEPTNPGSAAEGRLMNVRMVNAVFEEAGTAGAGHLPQGFDPDANTARFIARMPEYVANGVNAFTISLQGGMPRYEGAVNSAFEADGSLRPGYMERVARVIEAADRLGAGIILTAFYQRQHSHPRALSGRPAMFNAVANVARWIQRNGYENVVLEIANEYRHGGYRNWKHGEWLIEPESQVQLIRHAKVAAPGLLVSTSGMGDGTIAPEIAEAADFILLHLNTTDLADAPARIMEGRRYGKPVVVNEDDKVGAAGAESARLTVEHGAGWGFMHSAQNQYAPFEFEGVADDPVVYAMMRRLTTPAPVAAR